MNGVPVSILLWAVNFLLGIVLVLIGVILRMHQKADEEHRQRADAEIERLRQRFHDFSMKVGRVESDMQAIQKEEVKRGER